MARNYFANFTFEERPEEAAAYIVRESLGHYPPSTGPSGRVELHLPTQGWERSLVLRHMSRVVKAELDWIEHQEAVNKMERVNAEERPASV